MEQRNKLSVKIGRFIYEWADKKFGVKARGEVHGFKVINGVGVSNFTEKQAQMAERWHFFMKIKNKFIWK